MLSRYHRVVLDDADRDARAARSKQMNRLPARELVRYLLAQIFASVFAQVFACVIVGILLTGAVILAARLLPMH